MAGRADRVSERRNKLAQSRRRQRARREIGLERLEDRQLLTGDLTLGLSGNELVLTGDTSVMSLAVTFDPTNQTYTFTANNGMTFGNDGTLPNTVVYTPNGNTATLAPQTDDWATLGDTVGTNLTTSVGTVLTLGSPTFAASNFGTPFEVANSSGGETGLTIDDSSGNGGSTYFLFSTGLSISGGAGFDTSDATLTGLTIDENNNGSNAVTVFGTPVLPVNIPLDLSVVSGTGNSVTIGASTTAASSVGSITMSSGSGAALAVTVDDSPNTTVGETAIISSSAVSFADGPTFDMSGATVGSLAFNASSAGSAALTITGSPSTGSGPAPITLDMGSGSGDSLNLGDATHAAVGLGGISIGSEGAAIALTVDDSADTTSSPVANLQSQVFFENGPSFDFSGVTVSSETFDAANAGSATVNVNNNLSTGSGLAPLTVNMGTGTNNTTYLGNQADSLGSVTVATGSGGSTALQVDDTSGNGSWTYSVTATETDISSGSSFDYGGASLTSLSLNITNNGGNTVNVTGTPTLSPGNSLNIGAFSGGSQVVNLGDSSHPASGLGGVSVGAGSQAPIILTIDDSADTTSRSPLLEFNQNTGNSDFTGIGSAAFSYNGGVPTLNLIPSAVNGVTMSLTVNFANGNPFAGQGTSPASLGFNGVSSLSLIDSANSQNPDFSSETYTPTTPTSGTVGFSDGITEGDQGIIAFSTLSELTDSTPVSNYNFTAPTTGGEIAVVNSLSAGVTVIGDGLLDSFPTVLESNKTNVTIDALAVSNNNLVLLDNSTPSTGQLSLTVNLGIGIDTVNILANSSAVTTTINGGTGSQRVNVNTGGLANGTGSNNLVIIGGTGSNSLRLNTQGTTVSLSSGSPFAPAVASIGTVSSFGFMNMSAIQEFATNNAPTFASLLPTIDAMASVSLINEPVATFTDPDLIETAGSYQATINWGDGTSPTSGTIAADPTTPGKFIISGSHTYLSTGTDSIFVTLTDLGGTFNTTFDSGGGISTPVTTQLDSNASITDQTDLATIATAPTPPTGPAGPTGPTGATGPAGSAATEVTISGQVFLDVNANGVADADEPGIFGRTVFLDLDGDGTFDSGDPSAVTDASGHFTIVGVPTGSYTLRLESLPGDVDTGPTTGALALSATQSLSGENFGLQTLSTVSPLAVTPTPFGTTSATDSDAAIVTSLYNLVLGRAPDSGGFATWTQDLESGTLTVSEVAADFYGSTEYDTLVVESDYQTFLGRAADPTGLATWVGAMQAGASENQVSEAILSSPEFSTDHSSDSAFVETLYLDVLGRSGSVAEVAAWTHALGTGESRSTVVADFVTSPEAERRAIVDDYIDILGRQASGQEIDGWLTSVQEGTLTLDQVAEAFFTSPEFTARATS